MSTITRIKGTLDGKDLPVLTSEGLLPYWLGSYANRMTEAGYTLSLAQKNALSSFISELQVGGVLSDIIAMFPLIGSNAATDAVKEPLIGDVKFSFPDTFTSFYYDGSEIKGISGFPRGALTLSDVTTEHCYVVGLSGYKNATTESSSTVNIFRFWKNIGGDDEFTHIPQLYTGKNFRIVYNTSGRAIRFGNPINDIYNAGNFYLLGGIGDATEKYYYTRFSKIDNSDFSAASGTDITQLYVHDSSLDSFTTASSTFSVIPRLTSLVFFNKVISRDKAVAYMSSLQSLMRTLGKET